MAEHLICNEETAVRFRLGPLDSLFTLFIVYSWQTTNNMLVYHDMALSLFLARFLGLCLIILCSAVMVNRNNLTRIVTNLNPALVIVSGFMNIVLGLLLVLIHNVWVADWRIIITLLAWITLIKGVIRLYAPEKIVGFTMRFVKPRAIIISSHIFLLIGIYLTYIGFTIN